MGKNHKSNGHEIGKYVAFSKQSKKKALSLKHSILKGF
ncbi:hypothetical protein JOD25_001089 [Kurthia huakuii]|nr:hypothetical protein [Kurthia huakuii]